MLRKFALKFPLSIINSGNDGEKFILEFGIEVMPAFSSIDSDKYEHPTRLRNSTPVSPASPVSPVSPASPSTVQTHFYQCLQ